MIFDDNEEMRLYENQMLKNIESGMLKADTEDTIMKYFRHGQIWLTNHRFVGKACTKARYDELRGKLKCSREYALTQFACKHHDWRNI